MKEIIAEIEERIKQLTRTVNILKELYMSDGEIQDEDVVVHDVKLKEGKHKQMFDPNKSFIYSPMTGEYSERRVEGYSPIFEEHDEVSKND